jgi:hypothetical protein
MRFSNEDPDGIQNLRSTVERTYGVTKPDVALLFVVQMERERYLWSGIVAAFQLERAVQEQTCCYAWHGTARGAQKPILQMRSESIQGAEDAVAAWLSNSNASRTLGPAKRPLVIPPWRAFFSFVRLFKSTAGFR